MSVKIFHTSDIHIGLSFSGKNYSTELRKNLQRETLECLKRMVEMANAEHCDFFVVAGDMFDKVTVSSNLVSEAALILNNFHGENVIVLPGNHDYFDIAQDKLWKNFRSKMNENLLIFFEEHDDEEIEINDIKINFYAAPCNIKHSTENKIGWIKQIPKEKNEINIGIAHGSVEGISPDKEGIYFPMTLNELDEAGVDIWLLGHTHKRFPEKDGTSKPKYFMPSTPCPDGFDCEHEGFAWIIEIDEKKNLKYRSVQTGKYRFLHFPFEVYSEENLEYVKKELNNIAQKNFLLKLNISGRISIQQKQDLINFINEIRNKIGYLEENISELEVNIDDEFIKENFEEDSLPYKLLKELSEQKESLATQLAYNLIGEAKEK